MGFTYAIQVPVGKELQAKNMIQKTLERYNPGIVAIHAFETFIQKFRGTERAPKELKSKIPGYIFVTIDNTENFTAAEGGQRECGLGMEPQCWQLLKSIPYVSKILNRYIQHDEWNQFFTVTDLEPVIEISDKKENKRTLADIAKRALDFVKQKKDNSMKQVVTMLEKVASKTRGNRDIFTIPYSLFEKTRDRIDPHKVGEVRTLTNAQYILPELAKTIEGWFNG